MALSYHGNSPRHLSKADDLSRVQPPDAENRTSGGVEGLRGEIPVSPSDRIKKDMYLPMFSESRLKQSR